jgi:pimeloyl-ACP methyl ester carboxylesterase
MVFGRSATGRTRGLTGLVYATVRGVTRGVGGGIDAALGWLAPRLIAETPSTATRSAAIAALNGVLGDHLAVTRNPLAIRMALRHAGRPLRLQRDALAAAFPDAHPHVVVLVHGLCMNDLQWMRDGHDHGAALARDLPCTTLYLHYNSGLPISVNGRRFARLLQTLAAQWPVPLERLSIVGHSMGGLVARSACAHGARLGHDWLDRLDAIVFLGTPHRGAPLERGGHWFENLLEVSPYSAPFARLGRIRSAGITDLRHGTVNAAGCGDDADTGDIAPLPRRVRCMAIAGTLGRRGGDLKNRLVGDGLVPLGSALGRGVRSHRSLFARDAQWISYETSHLDLLARPAVYRRLRQWLGA